MARTNRVITIDGPAGAGKSTVARLRAERLGYTLVPTGAMYRALALSVTRSGTPAREGPELQAHLAPLSVSVKAGRVYLDGEDVTDVVRSQEVARVTSEITTLGSVRAKVTPLQRQMAAEGGVVLEGRDTGTVVCPDAEVKFYLTASLEARARRRQAELAAAGTSVSLAAITSELAARDKQDETRELAPLRKPQGAIELDTSDLTADQVVERLMSAIEHHQNGGGVPIPWNRLYATRQAGCGPARGGERRRGGAGLRAWFWSGVAQGAPLASPGKSDGDLRETTPVRGRPGRGTEGPVRGCKPSDDGRHFAAPGRYDCRHRPGPAGVGSSRRRFGQIK